MLKPNSKKARENAAASFAAFLADYAPEDLTESSQLETMIDNLIAGSTYSDGTLYSPLFKTIQDAFGMCVVSDMLPYYDQMREELASILEETPEEAAAFSDSKVYERLSAIYYREFMRLCEKHGKNIFARYNWRY